MSWNGALIVIVSRMECLLQVSKANKTVNFENVALYHECKLTANTTDELQKEEKEIPSRCSTSVYYRETKERVREISVQRIFSAEIPDRKYNLP